MAKIRVLLVDDHAVLRAGLRLLINSQPDMEVVGEASDTTEAASLVRELRPDIISLDLTMPGGSSLKLAESLRKEFSESRVLMLTMHGDAAYCRSALAIGAWGYVTKNAADSEFITAIRAVHRGEKYIDHGIRELLTSSTLGPAIRGPGTTPAGAPLLSQREMEVVKRLAQGYTNQEIADQLDLSVKTVESYRARVMVKCGFESRADLVRYAIETGLVRSATGIDAVPPV